MIEPTVEQYLIGTCLSIIDEFNILYETYTWEQLKKAADEKYNEMDITVKVGYPFKQTVHYAVGKKETNRKQEKINHDLYVEQRDFNIEIKFLKITQVHLILSQEVKIGVCFKRILIG